MHNGNYGRVVLAGNSEGRQRVKQVCDVGLFFTTPLTMLPLSLIPPLPCRAAEPSSGVEWGEEGSLKPATNHAPLSSFWSH